MSKQENNNPSWRNENSLTSPEDRTSTPQKPWKPNQGAPKLTEEEVSNAMEANNNTAFLHKFNAVERRYADPTEPLQRIGLISFVPAKGAKPNKNGVYGFAKLRGNYATAIESNERAEFLIRNVDSYHQIYHTYVGRPFPLTTSSDYSAETSEVDIRKEIKESVSTEVKKKRDKEKQEIQEIRQREEELVADSNREEPDTFENYITNRVKYAQLSWTYQETLRKLADMEDKIKKVRKHISDDDSSFPEFKNQYMEKYMKARTDAGLTNSKNELENSFMKFLNRYAELPFDQDDYVKNGLPEVTGDGENVVPLSAPASDTSVYTKE